MWSREIRRLRNTDTTVPGAQQCAVSQIRRLGMFLGSVGRRGREMGDAWEKWEGGRGNGNENLGRDIGTVF